MDIWSDVEVANSLMRYRFDSIVNISNKMATYNLKSFAHTVFSIGKELWNNGTLKKHTYGNNLYINIHFKVLILKTYRYMCKNELSQDQLTDLICAIVEMSYNFFYRCANNDAEILRKLDFMSSQSDYAEHFMQQISYFNAMVCDFEHNNYLIPFVINKTYSEFDENHTDSLERKMCAVLSEDLLMDYCFDNLTATFNAFASSDRPSMTREYHRACYPFYSYIFSELFE